MTTDITTWLLAQLDAEAETARAAVRGLEVHGLIAEPWRGDWHEWIAESDAVLAPLGGGVTEDLHNGRLAAHIARQDPQATLDRIDAIRAVVAMHYPGGYQGAPHCTTCAAWTPGDEDEDMRRSPVAWPCPTLRALAYAYRWQPGWESRWAPEGVSADA